MQMHTIEVDDEVYSYLESKVKHFQESANAVLRREFRLDDHTSSSSGVQATYQFPPGTPKALGQILQVVYLMRTEGLSRFKATHKVANHYEVAPQTVIDKYTRQLGLTATDFDRLLAESDRTNFIKYLNNKFTGYESLIKQYVS